MQNSAGNDGTSKDTIDIINITSDEEAKKLLVSEAEAAKIKLDEGEESKKVFRSFLILSQCWQILSRSALRCFRT